MTTIQKSTENIDLTSEDRQAALQQVERLLASTHFKNSRRYPDLLRYVVKETMAGHADGLKERTLGIEVFGREPGFDTAGDSIVRVAAAEVRKRIAQYYQEESHEDELRIDLPSGSYVPRFRRPLERVPEVPTVRQFSAPVEAAPTELAPSVKATHSSKFYVSLATAIVVLVLAAAVAGIKYMSVRNEQKDLLASVWSSSRDAVICIGSPQLIQNQPGTNTQTEAALGEPTVYNSLLPFGDAMTLSRLQVLLHSHGKESRVQLARTTTFENLRSGPAVLIGAFDNPWTLRLTSQMRFHFSGTDKLKGEIVDTKSKSDTHWVVDFHVPYSDRTQDFAIVAVTNDATLDQPLVIAAGIGPNGTFAASEFLIDQRTLDAVRRVAPAGWSGKNVEVVLSTQVIQGNSGPPKIVAAEYW